MSKQTTSPPKPKVAWGWYNFGVLLGVEHKRSVAICEIERHTGSPWSECRRYMQVYKVRVEVLK